MDAVHEAIPPRVVRRRGAPPAGERLTRDSVLAAAEALIERDGYGSFSVRGLAGVLGVRPAALYNHVRNRDELLRAVTERVVARIELPDAGGPWSEWVRTAATALRAQLIARPGLTDLVLARAGTTAAGPAVLRRFVDRLAAGGVDPAVAHVAWHAVLTVVVGSVQQERARGTVAADPTFDPTFDAVVTVTVDGIVAAASRPASREARDLLAAHTPDAARPGPHGRWAGPSQAVPGAGVTPGAARPRSPG